MKKIVLFLILCMGLVLATPVHAAELSEGTYVDVFDTEWFVDDVRYVYEGGLMDGDGRKFSPSATTTRGELIEAMYRLDGKPAFMLGAQFSDLPETSPYFDSVSWAVEKGIVNGYGDGRVGTGDSVTREQMVVILHRYASVKGIDLSNKADISSFSDAGTISSWAVNAVSWANAVGLINGTSSTTLSPMGTTTRAQVAAVTHRFGEKLIGKTFNTGAFVASHRVDKPKFVLVKKQEHRRDTTYHYDDMWNYLGKTVEMSNTGTYVECEYNSKDQLIRAREYVVNMGLKGNYVEYRCSYNERGQLTSITDSYGGTKKYDSTYDSSGRVVSCTEVEETDLYGIYIYQCKYKYLNDGYEKEYRMVGIDDYWVFAYGDDGRIVTEVSYHPDGTTMEDTYTYDEEGRLSSSRHVDSRKKDDFVEQYYYDERGDIIRVEVDGTHFGEPYHLKIEYENRYDAYGNLITQLQDGYGSSVGYDRPVHYTYVKID